MIFETAETELDGVVVLKPKIARDNRGAFVKTFHEDAFRQLGLDFQIREEFFSVSHAGVIRGMHFQSPPADHIKVVYCVAGRALDIVLDLRKSSPTFGRSASMELSEANREMLYIPSGFAHGFLALEDRTLLMYRTSFQYSPECDTGIRWDSFGFEWPHEHPIVSIRDAALPCLYGFESPFA